MGVIIILAIKDIRLLCRDAMGCFFTLIFPLIMSIFFGMVFSGNGGQGVKGVPVVIIDQDQSDGSRSMVALLKQIQEFSVTEMSSRDSALDLVRRGRQTAAIILPPGFGELSLRLFLDRPLRLIVAVDPSRRAEAGMIQGLLAARGFEYLQSQITDPRLAQRLAHQAIMAIGQSSEIPREYRLILTPFLQNLEKTLGTLSLPTTAPSTQAATNPQRRFELVRVENLPVLAQRQMRNGFAISFPQGIVWGLIGCAASFGISLVIERNHGTLTRLCVAPLSRDQVLLGKALACFVTTITVAAGLLGIAAVVFGVRPQSPLLLALSIACCAVAFVGIMMFLSVLGKTERSAAGIGWAVMLMMSMIGGGMVPLMFMPPWLVRFSHFSPVHWAILAIEGPLWRGFSASELLKPCGILLGIGVFGLLLGARAFRRLGSL